MQYQVYDEKTGELIAWINTEDNESIVKKGFSVRCGEYLMYTEDFTEAKTVFEKVSFTEYLKGCMDPEVITSIPLVNEGVEQHYADLKLPERKTFGSAGYDFIIPFDLIIPAGKSVKIPTGIKVSMEANLVLMMYPRSSLGFKYQMSMDNTVCVIDSDYYNNESNEGHIFVKMTNHSDKDCYLPKGTAYCQGVFHEFHVTDNDSVTEKQTRVGGSGSTDKK